MRNLMNQTIWVVLLGTALAAFGVSGSVLAQAKKREPVKAEKAIDPDAPVMAQGGVFKCIDRDGNVTYGNTGDVKGCKKIETDVINTAPAPKAGASSPAKNTTAARSDGTQRARDTDRKRILQEELAAEEKKLTELKKEFNGGEPERKGDEKNFQKYQDRTERLKSDVSRSESNVDSLRRELGSIRE
jgi:Domain of unknown function (DUF4124)